MNKRIVIVLLLLIGITVNAQCKKDRVLMTIDNQPVYQSEFLRVYNKNKDVVAEENKKNIDEYLDLFINYKLKLKEAFALKLDTIPSYVSEYNKYKQQLVEPFLKDRNTSEQLVKEAYDRSKKEIKARHILIKVNAQTLPADTLKAYNRILEARAKIIKGADFSQIANQYSEDPSVKKNGGDLGYFTAFSMVYPFENAAYNTNVGEISMPIKSSFGYHIIKVEDIRDSKGEIKVAHIMVKNNKEKPEYAKNQIQDIYQKFKQGENFEFLAKQYSDDKSTAVKGGVIKKFSHSRMIQPFADISFALKNEGDVSEPFETKFGWHFVKLIKKFPLGSYDDLKEDLAKKVEKGDRSVIVGNSIANKLKKEYKVKFNKDVLNQVLSAKKDPAIATKTILTVNSKIYKAKDLQKFFIKNKGKTYKDFVNEKVIDYYKDNLEKENKDYAATLTEYRDGLLLFDLLQKKIWNKAEKDTIGLQQFFNKNKANYNWKKRVDVEIASCTKLEKAKLVQKYLKEEKDINTIKNLVNEGATIHVLFNKGIYELNSKKLPTKFNASKGVSKIYTQDDKRFTVIKVNEILPSAPKKLNDAKGKIISDYQDYLEKEMIKNLRSKYSYKVNAKTLKKIKKKYK